MKRRSLFHGLLALAWPSRRGEAQTAVKPPKGPPVKRQGPTMDQLINLAEADKPRDYYEALLDLALQSIGPVAYRKGYKTSLYSVPPQLGRIPTLGLGVQRALIPNAESVLVPQHLLLYFFPVNRGEEFPAGIPFKQLKISKSRILSG